MPLTGTNFKNEKGNNKKQKLSDGEGLYLFISKQGSKLWGLAYRYVSKQNSLSFGKCPAATLQEARHPRVFAKEQLATDHAPGKEKKEAKVAAQAIQKEATNTFKNLAREWHASYSPSLIEKHAFNLMHYLEKDYFLVTGSIPVAELEPMHILELIRPVESKGRVNNCILSCKFGALSTCVRTYYPH